MWLTSLFFVSSFLKIFGSVSGERGSRGPHRRERVSLCTLLRQILPLVGGSWCATVWSECLTQFDVVGFLCSEIIQLSGAEIQKLRLANWELARTNSQMITVCSSSSFPNFQQVPSSWLKSLRLNICLVAYVVVYRLNFTGA